jgi:hypothetical protein
MFYEITYLCANYNYCFFRKTVLDTALRVYPKVAINQGGSIDSLTIAYLENQKQYELTNHLGNVLDVISDRKYSIDTTSTPNVTIYLT